MCLDCHISRQVLEECECQLKVLHPVEGDQELIQAVSAQLATLETYL